MMKLQRETSKVRDADEQIGVPLSDEDMEFVMGGLSRVWTPVTDEHLGAMGASPHEDPAAAAVPAHGLKP